MWAEEVGRAAGVPVHIMPLSTRWDRAGESSVPPTRAALPVSPSWLIMATLVMGVCAVAPTDPEQEAPAPV